MGALARPAGLRDRVVGNQRVALEALRRRVDLPGVQRGDDGAETLLQPALDLVAVGGLVGEERKDGVSHRDISNRYLYPLVKPRP